MSFGCVIPGRPVLTSALGNFRQVEATKFILDIPEPSKVRELTFFLVDPIATSDHGVALYSCLPGQDWKFVGYVTNQEPSKILRIKWPPGVFDNAVGELGVSLEPLQQIAVQAQGLEDDFVTFGKKIATDLFKYIQSFGQNHGNMEYIQVPMNILDRWIVRFEEKSRISPMFWLKDENI